MPDDSMVRRMDLPLVKKWDGGVVVRRGAFKAEPLHEGRAQMAAALDVAGLYMETKAHRVLVSFIGRYWFAMDELFWHLAKDGVAKDSGDLRKVLMFFNSARGVGAVGGRVAVLDHPELGSSVVAPTSRNFWSVTDALNFFVYIQNKGSGLGAEFMAVSTGSHVVFDLDGGIYRTALRNGIVREENLVAMPPETGAMTGGLSREEPMRRRLLAVSGLACLDCGRMATGRRQGEDAA